MAKNSNQILSKQPDLFDQSVVLKFKNGQINHYYFPKDYNILEIIEELEKQHNQSFKKAEIKDAVLILQ